MVTVVVPFRSGGKSRLPADIRSELSLAMLGDVLDAATAYTASVRLVTDDAAAEAIADRFGVETVTDPGAGQGAAVAAAVAGLDGACIVVNADLPCVSPGALARLAGLGLALVPAFDGTTNALSLPDPASFEPLYGPGSAARFTAAGFHSVSVPELERDVDTLSDIESLTVPVGRRTTLVLNQHKLVLARTR